MGQIVNGMALELFYKVKDKIEEKDIERKQAKSKNEDKKVERNAFSTSDFESAEADMRYKAEKEK